MPSLNDATKVAVRISEEAIKPPLDAKEQAMFIAGFQECIKWLNVFFKIDHNGQSIADGGTTENYNSNNKQKFIL